MGESGRGNLSLLKKLPWGWLLAVLFICAVLGPMLWMAHFCARPLRAAQVAAVGHAVDVSIALCAAYATLDGLRYHKRLLETTNTLFHQLDLTKEKILRRFREGVYVNDDVHFLVLLWLSGDDEVNKAVRTRVGELIDSDFFKSWRGLALRILLVEKWDRKLLIVLLVTLLSWQIFGAFVELRGSAAPALIPARGVWVILQLATLGYAAIAVSWFMNEVTLLSVRRSAQKWGKSIGRNLNENVDAPNKLDDALARAPSQATPKRVRPTKEKTDPNRG